MDESSGSIEGVVLSLILLSHDRGRFWLALYFSFFSVLCHDPTPSPSLPPGSFHPSCANANGNHLRLQHIDFYARPTWSCADPSARRRCTVETQPSPLLPRHWRTRGPAHQHAQAHPPAARNRRHAQATCCLRPPHVDDRGEIGALIGWMRNTSFTFRDLRVTSGCFITDSRPGISLLNSKSTTLESTKSESRRPLAH